MQPPSPIPVHRQKPKFRIISWSQTGTLFVFKTQMVSKFFSYDEGSENIPEIVGIVNDGIIPLNHVLLMFHDNLN